MTISRRQFIGQAAVAGGGVLAFNPVTAAAQRRPMGRTGFGPLLPDARGLLALPPGFRYRVISQQGAFLNRPKALVPGDHDGQAAFPGPRGTTILVRNHELSPGDVEDGDDTGVPQRRYINAYDETQPGGTTGIIVGRRGRETYDYVTSAGTNRNCSGGPTPWNTWITCEETRIMPGDDGATKQHGYCFEVNPYQPADEESAEPITEMGFFSHEAIAVDPRTGIVYLTEDDFRGQIPQDPREEKLPTIEGDNIVDLGTRASFLYRFVPNEMPREYGDLRRNGGRLQAMTIAENTAYNVDLAQDRQRFQVDWVDVDPAVAHDDALRKGAARFNRLEGADFRGGAFWFDDTAGAGVGATGTPNNRLGQIFRLRPGVSGRPDTLELFFQSNDENEMQSPDNLVVTPWGDVWFCEDGQGTDRVMGITPEGEVYPFARNRLNTSEFAGCTFSPDGRLFFVNIQSPGLTFVIWGPFRRGNRRRREQMGRAAPPAHLGPRIDDELREAARRNRMGVYEAAAFEQFGVPIRG